MLPAVALENCKSLFSLNLSNSSNKSAFVSLKIGLGDFQCRGTLTGSMCSSPGGFRLTVD